MRTRWHLSTGYLVLVCMIWVVLADFFFWYHPVGWTLGLFGLILGGGLLGRFPHTLKSLPVRWLSGLLLALCLGLVYDVSLLPVLMLIGLLLTLKVTLDLGWGRRFDQIVHYGFMFLFLGWQRGLQDLSRIRKWRMKHGHAWRINYRNSLSWLASILLTLLFLVLFSLANPVLANWRGQFFQWFSRIEIPSQRFDFMRLLFWGVCFLLAWMLLRFRFRHQTYLLGFDQSLLPGMIAPPATILMQKSPAFGIAALAHQNPAPGIKPESASLPFDLGRFVTRSLILFNLVFGLQAVMDLVFLWGGARLPKGMTYAEYAHHGAYPLILTALLAALFVLLTFRPGGPAERSLLARRLVYLWLAQNLFLMASATRRLDLYVGFYSLTRMRLATVLWMLLVLFGLTSIIWRIVRRHDNRWLCRINALAVFALLYVCCFWNTDGFIAGYNVRHARDLGGSGLPLDLGYMRELGPDALPAIKAALPAIKNAEKHAAASELLLMWQSNLTRQTIDWRGWTLRRLLLLRVSRTGQ